MAAARSSSTLVNVAEDAEVRLVKLLAETESPVALGSSFVSSCENCIVHSDASGLMAAIVGDPGAISSLLVLESSDEATSAFSLLAALLQRVRADRPLEEAPLAAALAEAVHTTEVTGVEEVTLAVRRITLLSALYNLRHDGTEKCDLLAKMISLAKLYQPAMLQEGQALGNLLLEQESASILHQVVPRAVVILDGWKVAPKDRRVLYKAAAESMPDSVIEQRFMLLLVETYNDTSEIDADGLAAATKAAIGAIRDPVTLFKQQRSMLLLPAIQALANNANTKALHGLLTIFQEGSLDDYLAFPGPFPEGLSQDDCVRHMKILSLCSLAANHEEIFYKDIAQALQLPSEDQVESWVIAAVSSGLLEAKMDQLQRKVLVERSIVRKFDEEQWKALLSELTLWKNNVRGILETFKQSQAAAAGVAPTN